MLKTIKTYFTEAEADVVLSILESNQIEGYLFNSFSSTIYPIFNQSIGGVELKVKTEDFDKALQILTNLND